jgi:cytosine deaminase
MVTTSPARLLGLEGYGLSPGSYADLVVVDAERPTDAVSAPADVVATCHRGRLTYGSVPGRC